MKTIKLVCFPVGLLAVLSVTAQPVLTRRPAVPLCPPAPLASPGVFTDGQQFLDHGQSVQATPKGGQLRAMFQRLEGEATAEGLWLISTADPAQRDAFRVLAVSIGRENSAYPDILSPALFGTDLAPFPRRGKVQLADNLLRFVRPGLVEEYSVSLKGVRQDFVVEASPGGTGALRVELEVAGARVEPRTDGARLLLEPSGRKLAYSRLQAFDATGCKLSARLEVCAADRLAIIVADAQAVYPVRIDPTFSDDNYFSLGLSTFAIDGPIFASTVDDSGNLYIGGAFTTVAGVDAMCIAKFDGQNWSSLGSGVDSYVWALAASGTNIYAGGDFLTAGGASTYKIAKWNGSTWSALGSGMDDDVYALLVSGTNLYAGGIFTAAGGVSASRIARWNGQNWSPLGLGLNAKVAALAGSDTSLFAGGGFNTAGAVTANKVARWDGNTWSSLTGSRGNGITSLGGRVYAVAVSGTDLYVGGSFVAAGGYGAFNIAKWNGSEWSWLGPIDVPALNHDCNALVVSGNLLYVGGAFTYASGQPAAGIALWNGYSLQSMNSVSNGATVTTLSLFGTDLYAGGGFPSFDGVVTTNLAVITVSTDGTWEHWRPVLPVLDDRILTIMTCGANVYAAGEFTRCGKTALNHIARWDGTNWWPLGSGLNGNVYALAFSGTNLYAGGNFTTAGATPANCIAKWNGSVWSPLGPGLGGGPGSSGNDTVYALLPSGTNLYAGGWFNNAGIATMNFVARWNGTAWSALGSGMNAPVGGLAVCGTDLYASGFFTSAGGVAANYIAKWDGNNWSALGSGMNNVARPLAVCGTNLYAGGRFTTAGGLAANHIARWNGSTWSALGSGTDDDVEALAVCGSDLYVGGSFANAGVITGNNIAKWNGTSWSALGSGTDASIWGLAVGGSDLFLAGSFSAAGSTPAYYGARIRIGAGKFTNLAHSKTTGFRFTYCEGAIGLTHRIQVCSSLPSGNWTDLTNFTYAAAITITDTQALGASTRFYRAVSP